MRYTIINEKYKREKYLNISAGKIFKITITVKQKLSGISELLSSLTSKLSASILAWDLVFLKDPNRLMINS